MAADVNNALSTLNLKMKSFALPTPSSQDTHKKRLVKTPGRRCLVAELFRHHLNQLQCNNIRIITKILVPVAVRLQLLPD